MFRCGCLLIKLSLILYTFYLGELLLSDEGKLSLPASALRAVNRAFETISTDEDFETSFEATPASSSKIPHLHNVQMLYDFVQKLTRLKVSK
jgi:hypothetical protein